MKLLATDFDGTLKYASRIMDEDLEKIKEWKQAGNLFVICTGRSFESISQQQQEYNLPVDYFVTNNGGMVFDKNGTELMANYLDLMMAVDLVYVAKEMEDVVSVVVNDGVNRYKYTIDASINDPRYGHLSSNIEDPEDFMKLSRIAQVVISCTETQRAINLAEDINMFFGEFVTAYANNFVVDIVPKDISKADGLEFLAEYEGIHLDDIYTIGDSYNDVPMLSFTQNSACVYTAAPEVQATAKNAYESVGAMIDAILK